MIIFSENIFLCRCLFALEIPGKEIDEKKRDRDFLTNCLNVDLEHMLLLCLSWRLDWSAWFSSSCAFHGGGL